jgi:hypothetical protein
VNGTGNETGPPRDWPAAGSARRGVAAAGRYPRGRRTYHSVNSRHRPAESNRITKQLS